MRPVNLLPERDRVRRPAQDQPGTASYVVLGVLGALLLAVVGYVVTQNQVNARTSEIAVAEQEKAEAEQRAARLGSFGEFAQIKETRVRSVTELAQSRFDWERLMRELALVLPADTWLTEVSAGPPGLSAGGSAPAPAAPGAPAATPGAPAATPGAPAATPGAPAATPGAPAATLGAPTLAITGCSKSQQRVAVVLVRLRKLHRAIDVQLTESGESETSGAVSGGTDSAAVATAGECSFFKFQATVTFEPRTGDAPEAEKRSVPAVLGGGA